MADSASDILKTTINGTKKKMASHKVGTEITDSRPQLVLAKKLDFTVYRPMVSNMELGNVNAFIFILLTPRCNHHPKTNTLHLPM